MTNFRMMITNEGKHPASKWADLAVDDLMEISAQAPAGLFKEAMDFRKKLHAVFTKHTEAMMAHEQKQIADGKHDLELPYETEKYTKDVVKEITDLAKGTSFEKHFAQENVQEHIANVCNHYFKSAKHVERQHYHSEKAADSTKKVKKG